MARTKHTKKVKRLKLWHCIKCGCYVGNNNRRFHKGHPGRWGTPTTAFFEGHRLVNFSDGSSEWHEKQRTFPIADETLGDSL